VVRTDDDCAFTDFKLISLAGQIIRSGRFVHKEAVIDTNGFAKGVYLLLFRCDGEYSTKKVQIWD
jgi:hypothetical protein